MSFCASDPEMWDFNSLHGLSQVSEELYHLFHHYFYMHVSNGSPETWNKLHNPLEGCLSYQAVSVKIEIHRIFLSRPIP